MILHFIVFDIMHLTLIKILCFLHTRQGKSEPLTTPHATEAKNPFDVAGKPGTPKIKDFDRDFVELEWTRPDTDGGAPITGYVIEKKDRFAPDWEECAQV